MNNKIWIETDGKMELLEREPTKDAYELFKASLSESDLQLVENNQITIAFDNNGYRLGSRC